MNRENIDKLIRVIEQLPRRHPVLDMSSFHMRDDFILKTENPCGSAACIAGWAHAVVIRDQNPEMTIYEAEREGAIRDHMSRQKRPRLPHIVAQEYLGLTDKQAGDLFYMRSTSLLFSDIQIPHVILALKNLRDGRRVWRGCKKLNEDRRAG